MKEGIAKIGAMNDEIVPELAKQMGRSIRYAGEFAGIEERAFYMADIAHSVLEPILTEDNPHFRHIIKCVAQGVVLVIAPWDYPYMTAINSIAPALIAGNAVVLKHSYQTPLVGIRLAHAFQSVGIPAEIFQNLMLDHQTTAQLISSRAFDFINFTGSVGGGKAIETAASGTFTGLGLELGEKDPGYVMEDADLDAAVETLVDGAMFIFDQCCCSIERIYVVESLFDSFVEKAVQIVQAYKLGNPLDTETTLGPIAQERLANEVSTQTYEAVAAGAIPLISPSLFPQDSGAYLMSQVLVNVDHTMRAMREESFGPVVGIMPVKDYPTAITLMNDSNFGLTASLWTKNPKRAESIANQIATVTNYMKCADYLDPALCWTGCKDTGRSGGLSIIGYHNLTRPKSYHLKKA